MECEQCGWVCDCRDIASDPSGSDTKSQQDGDGDEIHECEECGRMYCGPCIGGHGCAADDPV